MYVISMVCHRICQIAYAVLVVLSSMFVLRDVFVLLVKNNRRYTLFCFYGFIVLAIRKTDTDVNGKLKTLDMYRN